MIRCTPSQICYYRLPHSGGMLVAIPFDSFQRHSSARGRMSVVFVGSTTPPVQKIQNTPGRGCYKFLQTRPPERMYANVCQFLRLAPAVASYKNLQDPRWGGWGSVRFDDTSTGVSSCDSFQRRTPGLHLKKSKIKASHRPNLSVAFTVDPGTIRRRESEKIERRCGVGRSRPRERSRKFHDNFSLKLPTIRRWVLATPPSVPANLRGGSVRKNVPRMRDI